MTKQGYEVNGEIVDTLKEVAKVLGVEAVTKRDITGEGKYADMVSLVDLEEDEEMEMASGDEDYEEDSEEDSDDEDIMEDVITAQGAPSTEETDEEFEAGYPQGKAPVEEWEEEEPKPIFSTVADSEITLTADEVRATLPDFHSLDELKEFIKDLDTPTLEYIAKSLKVEWEPTYHASIHRMRIAMAMHRLFFPELFAPKEDKKKKKAKYGDFSTEQLFKMAKTKGINVQKSGNDPIDRMRAIMLLKEAGVLKH